VLVLSVRGEIDLVSVPQLEEALRKAETSAAKRVVLDLADVEFMDSSGLHALLRAWQRFEQNRGRLVLSRVSPQVRRLLELTGTDLILGVERRRELSAGRDVHSSGT
jgi:anti-anti-sigma factor